MRLPNTAAAIIDREKLIGYLLNPNHPVGHTKAVFFNSLGFAANEWDILAAAFREHAFANDVTLIEAETFGVTYIVEGPLQTPRGLSRRSIRVVWIIKDGEEIPRLVTAYPAV